MQTNDGRPVRVLVTGASGNVGREVVRAARARGLVVRGADRNPERLRERLGDVVEPVELDFERPDTYAGAVVGCDFLFLLRPPAIADVGSTLNPFVDVALAAGVRHVVFLSVAGAGKNPLVPHHAVETHLARRTESWTFLRPGFFAQNLGDAYRRDIVEDARLYLPAGRGAVAFVDVRDVAEVAASIFVAPEAHRGQAYTLTGPEAVDLDRAAELLSAATGRPVRYQPASIAGYARHLRKRRGLGLAQLAVQTVLHVGLRFGQAETVDPTLQRLLRHPSRTLSDYVRDHADTWSTSPPPPRPA